MRSAQKSNRSRGRGNRKSGGGGGNNINRVYDSAGPEGKVRGTPQQIIDKYTTLARDAQTSGDRVAAENFLQHAEHYQRILIQAMGAQEQTRRDQGQNAGDDQTDDEQGNGATHDRAEAQQAAEVTAQAGGDQPDIGGMAMIDAGDDAGAETLLVEADEIARSQPKRNGRAKRPKAEAKAEDGAAAQVSDDSAAPADEASAEGTA